jgi:hypothetical protein
VHRNPSRIEYHSNGLTTCDSKICCSAYSSCHRIPQYSSWIFASTQPAFLWIEIRCCRGLERPRMHPSSATLITTLGKAS